MEGEETKAWELIDSLIKCSGDCQMVRRLLRGVKLPSSTVRHDCSDNP